MYSMYWYVWYVLYELVCNDMYLMVYACIACIVCIVRIGMYGMYGMYLYVLYVLNVLLCSRMYLLVYKNTYQYIPIHANTKNLYNCYQWESTQRHFNFMSNALPTGQTISEIFTSLYVYVCICMYGMYWYAIHTSTCTCIPIHTRAQTYTAPYLRFARPDGPTLFPVCSQCCGQHCTRIWKAEGGEAPSGDAKCCLPLGNRPRNHESARWRSPCARTWPLSHAQLLPTV